MLDGASPFDHLDYWLCSTRHLAPLLAMLDDAGVRHLQMQVHRTSPELAVSELGCIGDIAVVMKALRPLCRRVEEKGPYYDRHVDQRIQHRA